MHTLTLWAPSAKHLTYKDYGNKQEKAVSSHEGELNTIPTGSNVCVKSNPYLYGCT